MSNNIGNDFLIIDFDLAYDNLGDYLTTDSYEKGQVVPFEGYICLYESISRYIYYLAGEYDIFNIHDGAGAEDLVSITQREEAFSSFKSRALEQFSRDDRIKKVVDITFTEIDINLVHILITLIIQGQSFQSEFIFPYSS